MQEKSNKFSFMLAIIIILFFTHDLSVQDAENAQNYLTTIKIFNFLHIW